LLEDGDLDEKHQYRYETSVLHSAGHTLSAQSAVMVLQLGESTGEPQNEHPRSEQWLFVVSGTGAALVNKRRLPIREKSLLLIKKGEVHQVRNTGRHPLVTLNFYAPPAYSKDGEPNKLNRR
jgi:mannose-6-phosphate isomerase-like protein (cupin superfamily)